MPTVAHNQIENRLVSLDGLRALAILMVLGSHIPYGAKAPDLGLAKVFFDGDLGVRIFFVISDFLITLLLAREHQKYGRIDLRQFFARRALRILPLYVTYLAVLLSLQMLGIYYDEMSTWLGSFTFTRNIVGRGDSATAHFWSLAVEEQFYVFWPATCMALGLLATSRTSVRRAVLILLLTVGVGIFSRHIAESHFDARGLLARLLGPRSALRYCDSIALGCLAALIYRKTGNSIPVLGRVGQICIAVSWSAITFGVPKALSTNMQFIVPVIQAVATAALVLLAARLRSGPLFCLLNNRPTVFIGVLSYSLYVWHVMFLAHFFGSWSTGRWIFDWPWWLLCSMCVAYLSHRWIETPFLDRRRNFQPRSVPRSSRSSEVQYER